ncbi:MAG: ribosomal L7Ae/L30e/S12e/Gadd45 family protein [Evtepia gabavorous]
MLTDLKSAKKVTGAKQVTRALKNGTARRVFLAQDADPG